MLRAAGVVAVCYLAAYYVSVTAAYVQIKAVSFAVPVYRPCDAAVVHRIFAPLQLLDAAYLRPSRWQEKLTR